MGIDLAIPEAQQILEGTPPMLRITPAAKNVGTVTLKLEGKIHGEWASLLEQECFRLVHQQKQVRLDFSGVSYVDPEGIQVVRNLLNGHIQIINCPRFIVELLDRGGQP